MVYVVFVNKMYTGFSTVEELSTERLSVVHREK